MPQQGGPPGNPSAREVIDDVEDQDDPNADEQPEALQNVVQDLLLVARDILDDLNDIRIEPLEILIQRPPRGWARAQIPPGRILMPAGFFGRAMVGDNFRFQPQPGEIPFRPAGLFRRQIYPPAILRQPVRQRLNIRGMVRHQIHRAVILERPNNENFEDDVEAGQHAAMAEANQRLAIAAEAHQRLAIAAEADQRFEMAAETDQPLEMAAEADQQVEMAAEADQQVEMIDEDYQQVEILAEANQQVAMVSEADQQVAMVSEANQQVPMVSEANQQVAMVSEANQQVAMVAEANQQVAMVAEADQEKDARASERNCFVNLIRKLQ